jgi:hypothetical protein
MASHDNNKPSTANGIVKCGWLKKKGQLNQSWKRRWFVLKGHALFYYDDENVRSYIVFALFLC